MLFGSWKLRRVMQRVRERCLTAESLSETLIPLCSVLSGPTDHYIAISKGGESYAFPSVRTDSEAKEV